MTQTWEKIFATSPENWLSENDVVRDLAALTFFFIDEPFLLRQEQFFLYTRALIKTT